MIKELRLVWGMFYRSWQFVALTAALIFCDGMLCADGHGWNSAAEAMAGFMMLVSLLDRNRHMREHNIALGRLWQLNIDVPLVRAPDGTLEGMVRVAASKAERN